MSIHRAIFIRSSHVSVIPDDGGGIACPVKSRSHSEKSTPPGIVAGFPATVSVGLSAFERPSSRRPKIFHASRLWRDWPARM